MQASQPLFAPSRDTVNFPHIGPKTLFFRRFLLYFCLKYATKYGLESLIAQGFSKMWGVLRLSRPGV